MPAMFVNGSERNEQSLQRTFQGCLLLSFDSFGKAVLEETIFQKSTNQKQELSVVAMFVNGSELNEKFLQKTFQGYFLPSFDSFGKAVSEEKIFYKLTNQKQELPVAAMFILQIRIKSAIFIDNLPRMLPTISRFIWQSGYRVEDFLEINQSETRIALGGHVC